MRKRSGAIHCDTEEEYLRVRHHFTVAVHPLGKKARHLL